MEIQPIIVAVFAAYFAALIGIAIVGARRMREMSDYVLAGRKMSTFTSALSASSSSSSGWTMLVFPALAFSEGTVHLWTAVSIAAGAWFSWTILGKRLRRYTIAEESLTLPDFFEKRFADRTGTLRTVSAVLTMLFIMFYVNSGLIAGAKLLETIFGLEHNPSVLITLAAVVSYTFIGGFMAVSRTDVFQSLVMLVSFIILPLTLIAATAQPFTGVGDSPGFMNPLTDAADDPITWVFLLSTVGWGLGALGSQRVLQRFMAIESEAKITSSRNIGIVWVILIFSFGFLLGVVARPALTQMGLMDELIGETGMLDPELVYFVVSDAFFIPVFTGLLLTGVIAAIMSTADSQLLLGSAIATDDVPLIRRLARRLELTHVLGASGRVWLGRALLLAIGSAAGASAIIAPDSVSNLVAYAWGGMGAAFGPVTILALYWRRFNFWGALASIVAGAGTVTVWQVTSGGPWGVFDMAIATAPGFVAAGLAGAAATLLTSQPSTAITEQFDRVKTDTPAA
ncbi:MAG: sodium/proline symporter [Chloroflexi bacterium]|nr:sodium/proline symporter [Chloroflexota bacterium]